MGIFIEGFGISGYRSFGKNIQRIGPLSKINIFAGQNNSGKSNILNYLINIFPLMLRSANENVLRLKLNDIDTPIKDWDRKTRVEIGIIQGGNFHKELRKLPDLNNNYLQWIDNILFSDILLKGTNVAWIPFQTNANEKFSIDPEVIEKLANNVLGQREWQMLWSKITQRTQGDIKAHWVPETLKKFVSTMVLPSISIIPSIRKYTQERTDRNDDFSGLGIIDKLAKLQNPSYKEQSLKDSF